MPTQHGFNLATLCGFFPLSRNHLKHIVELFFRRRSLVLLCHAASRAPSVVDPANEVPAAVRVGVYYISVCRFLPIDEKNACKAQTCLVPAEFSSEPPGVTIKRMVPGKKVSTFWGAYPLTNQTRNVGALAGVTETVGGDLLLFASRKLNTTYSKYINFRSSSSGSY
jgi:hypothetical protein